MASTVMGSLFTTTCAATQRMAHNGVVTTRMFTGNSLLLTGLRQLNLQLLPMESAVTGSLLTNCESQPPVLQCSGMHVHHARLATCKY